MQLSKDRANEVRKKLEELYKVSPDRLESIGRGWEEPAGTDSDRTGVWKYSGLRLSRPGSGFGVPEKMRGG